MAFTQGKGIKTTYLNRTQIFMILIISMIIRIIKKLMFCQTTFSR